MSKSNAVGRIFNDAYQKLTKAGKCIPRIEFRGIIAGITKRAPGDMVCYNYDDGSRYILVGTRFGTVAVGDASCGQTDGGQYKKIIPDSKLVSSILPSSSPFVSTAEMASIVGPWGKMGNNIGFTIEDIIDELKEELAK